MSTAAAPVPASRPASGFSPDANPFLAAPRILVVEDETTVAMLIEDMICELSFAVAAVTPRLESAMRMLEGAAFDLAILDVHLNGKTVFPFAAELQSRAIPFLFATAYDQRTIPAAFAGHPVLLKPFGPAELRRALLDLSGRALH